MRVFLTGASGYLGLAVVAELRDAGHEVVGLVRSPDSAARIADLGATALEGDVQDRDALTRGARDADAVAHLAWVAPAPGVDPVAVDRAAITALGDALRGTGRRLVIASGVLGLHPGRVVTEADRPSASTSPALAGRAANGEFALSLVPEGVASVLVRLAPTVHDDGRIKPGFVGRLVAVAREHGSAGYPGEGSSRWAAVHRLDAAHLFRLALERAEAGTTLHAVAEEGVSQLAIARTIGTGLDVPIASLPDAELDARYGWLGLLMRLDGPAFSTETRARLDWTPTRPTLLEDLRDGAYFDAPRP